MNTSKPIIGVTGPDYGGKSAWIFTRFAIWRAGGKAVRITPSNPLSITKIDGLILGGGADINPQRYLSKEESDFIFHAKPDKGLNNWISFLRKLLCFPVIFLFRKIFSTNRQGIDSDRDDLEFSLLDKALKRQIPVLGICRGAQLINVKFGGDLYQDLKNFYNEIPQLYTIWPKKTVEITHSSRLYEVFKMQSIQVNALHRQAVKTVARELKPTAREPNGVIQALEHKGFPFVIGVQWHPEYLPQVYEQLRLFEALIKEAVKFKNGIKVTPVISKR